MAGLAGDLEWTAGAILEDGAPTEYREAYLCSLWATPRATG